MIVTGAPAVTPRTYVLGVSEDAKRGPIEEKKVQVAVTAAAL